MDDDWKYRNDLILIYNLVSKGINAADKNGHTPLMLAACRYPDIAKALIDAGADINKQCNSGKTALYSAAAFGNLELVKTLLDAGADPELEDTDGHTALVYPAIYGYIDVVKLLADAIGKKRANHNGFEIETAVKVIERKVQMAQLDAETADMKNAIMEKIKGGGRGISFHL